MSGLNTVVSYFLQHTCLAWSLSRIKAGKKRTEKARRLKMSWWWEGRMSRMLCNVEDALSRMSWWEGRMLRILCKMLVVKLLLPVVLFPVAEVLGWMLLSFLSSCFLFSPSVGAGRRQR